MAYEPAARRIRARPGSLDSWRGICSKSHEHDADHGEAEECSNGQCVAFEVASQAAVTTEANRPPVGDGLRGWACRIRTSESVREPPNWICVTIPPEVGASPAAETLRARAA